MTKIKILIYDDTFKNNQTLDCYFEEFNKICDFLDEYKSKLVSVDFIKLIDIFKQLYKVYYELNKPVDLNLGGNTYISLTVINP